MSDNIRHCSKVEYLYQTVITLIFLLKVKTVITAQDAGFEKSVVRYLHSDNISQ